MRYYNEISLHIHYEDYNQNDRYSKSWQGCRGTGTSDIVGDNVKQYSHFGKQAISQKIKGRVNRMTQNSTPVYIVVVVQSFSHV